ncbi:MAG: methyltransferase type 11, partial [Bacteroidia bacterium]|nr:methyltransferase type 11 [Bacteroidia bacterium]
EGQLEKATLKKKLGKLKRNFQAQMNKVLVKNRYYNYFHIGKFRMGGEIHQWMYDQYSLKKLLSSCRFKDPQVKTASESGIPHWAECNLDLIEGAVNKPDSLFMEAYK